MPYGHEFRYAGLRLIQQQSDRVAIGTQVQHREGFQRCGRACPLAEGDSVVPAQVFGRPQATTAIS